MRESKLEHYLDARVKSLGGFTRKVTYQGRTGAPDRWCFLPGGIFFMVELKAPGKKPRSHQEVEINRLNELGQHAYIADSKEAVNEILRREVPSLQAASCP